MRCFTRYLSMALALSWIAAPGHASLLFADFSTFMDVHLGPAGSVMTISVSGVACPASVSRTDQQGHASGKWCTNPDGSWAPDQSFPPDSALAVVQDAGPVAFLPSGGLDIGPLDDTGPGGDPGPSGGVPPSDTHCGALSYQYVDPTSACPLIPGVGGAPFDIVSDYFNGPEYYYGVAGPNFNIGEVVGTFSTNPSWADFVGVGNHYSFVVPDGVTEFYLIVNDGYRADNAGAYDVLTPEPGSSALLGFGLIVIAGWIRRNRRRAPSDRGM